ncbi:MAG TPA: hypothetical protein PK239_17330 [Chitinophagales bacterium]|mgnify:CR=1 FL=1|nr:hypothetical protein [Chitinophagales bacterium]HRK29039.1 hypothetical protein [Chitinophagales bacterium]
MLFSQIIGQHSIKAQLIQHALAGRVSHAQLFLGNEGSGNLPLALAYAQYLNCAQKQPHDSCGRCNSCLMSAKLAHPDIHFTYPTVSMGSKGKISTDYITEWRQALNQNPYLNVFEWLQFIKAENKQGNITADECDEIVKKLTLTTYQGNYKIIIIWMPEYLGKEGNKLLKAIEEPPPNTVFLLVAQNADALLSTILSRTQLLRIPPLNMQEIANQLTTEHQINPDTAQQIAAIAQGNYNAALQLLSNANTNNRQMLLQWFAACLQNNVPEFARFTDEIAEKGREIQKNFIGYSLHFLNQCLRLAVLPPNTLHLDAREKELANQLLPHLHLPALQYLISSFEKADEHISRNANPKIVFFNLSVRLAEVVKGATVLNE